MNAMITCSRHCSVVAPLKHRACIGSKVSARPGFSRSVNCPGPSGIDHCHSRQVVPHSVAGSDASFTDKPLPNAFWRAFAAFIYVVPLVDTFTSGTFVYAHVPQLLIIHHIGSYFAPYYWSTQFTALIIFFLIFLGIVKNKKLHHFVRFNAMQAMMLDILVMLPVVTQAYIPKEIMWTVLGMAFINTCFISMACALLYSFGFTLFGKYADIPYVSEAVYMQVHQCDLMG